MAFEQMRTFLAGGTQESLGGVAIMRPDRYPLLLTSELRREHETLSELIETSGPIRRGSEIRANPTLLRMCETDAPQRTRYCLALIERIFAYHAKLTSRKICVHAAFFDCGPAAEAIAVLFDRGVEAEKVVPPLLEWFTAYRFNLYATPVMERAVEWIARTYAGATLPGDLRTLLIALRCQFDDVDYRPAQIEMALDHRTDLLKFPGAEWLQSAIDAIIGKGPWLVLAPCEVWAAEALEQIKAAAPEQRERWFTVLNHCRSATSARPSARWLKQGLALLDAVGSDTFVSHVLSWFERVNEGRMRPTLGMSTDGDERQRMHEVNAAVLRGLLWLCPTVAGPELIGAMAKVCFSAFRKIRGLGTRSIKVGNAGVYAFGQIDHSLALGQLALLRTRVKLASAQKAIEKAFALTAERSGLSREEIDEMSVPTYGMTDVGAGNTLEEVASAADIQRTLAAQRDRIDTLFLRWPANACAGWPVSVWRERYLDHPLVGTLARRILWEFADEGYSTVGIWREGQIVDIELKRIPIENPGLTVRLWHPIGKHMADIGAWQALLEAQQIQQPFKQAHREVYAPTESQRQTRTQSDRFASHVLKQHQFHELCKARGWKDQVRRMGEAEPAAPTLQLPQWGLRAEFHVEGIGCDYGADGADTNEDGVYFRVATGHVRFYRIEAAEPMPIEEVPPLVFSEVLRDVELFIAGASIGNEPNWADGGPQGRHRAYWQNYCFGELNALAVTRKEVLQRLVPQLQIASLCKFEERFLVVQGKERLYKIHFGSGHILMEPDDHSFYMVAKQTEAEGTPVPLPFEGDPTLSAIISKAFLLADDAKLLNMAA